MDTLYTGNIPKDYKYIYLKDGYIYIFNKSYIENETLNCYKIDNNNGFIYCFDSFSSDSLIQFEKVNVTNKHYYRTDYCNILFCSISISIILIWIFNICTSIYKRGGILSGLF